eukprot:2514596-Alexandrium_andersonii.AAC.1
MPPFTKILQAAKLKDISEIKAANYYRNGGTGSLPLSQPQYGDDDGGGDGEPETGSELVLGALEGPILRRFAR